MLDASPEIPPPPAKVPLINAPRVVLVLIGAIIAVHLARVLAGEDISTWALRMFAFIPAQTTGAAGEVWPLQRYWTLISYAFLHSNGMHLIFNSLWMLIFGSFVARRLSTPRFLLLALIATVAGAAAMLVNHADEFVPVIGASGAVSGFMAAAVPLMYGGNYSLGYAIRGDVRTTRPLRFLELLQNRGALIFMAVWLVITLITGAAGFDDGVLGVGQQIQVAWEAHIGGFIAGLAAFYLLDRRG